MLALRELTESADCVLPIENKVKGGSAHGLNYSHCMGSTIMQPTCGRRKIMQCFLGGGGGGGEGV